MMSIDLKKTFCQKINPVKQQLKKIIFLIRAFNFIFYFILKITIDENDNPIDFKQIIPKPKDGEESQQFSNILEAKFHNVSDRVVFVVLTTKGLFVRKSFIFVH